MMADSGMNVNDSERHGVDPGQIDLINRDPKDLNGHLSVLFEDIIGEPEGAHSADVIWTWAFKCFTGGKRICYLILTYICAIPMALWWGINVACISFCHIWHITPCFHILKINLFCFQKFVTLVLGVFVQPCVEVQALIFSKIHVTVQNV